MPTTLDPAAKLGALAAAIAQALAVLAPEVTVYDHEPVGSLYALPALYVGLGSLDRSALRQGQEPGGETVIAHDDWLTSWPLTLQLPLTGDHPGDFARARALLGRVVSAIDADWTLGGEADEARIVSADLGFNTENRSAPLIVAECELSAISFMPRP